jgi:hypothetical protein
MFYRNYDLGHLYLSAKARADVPFLGKQSLLLIARELSIYIGIAYQAAQSLSQRCLEPLAYVADSGSQPSINLDFQ